MQKRLRPRRNVRQNPVHGAAGQPHHGDQDRSLALGDVEESGARGGEGDHKGVAVGVRQRGFEGILDEVGPSVKFNWLKLNSSFEGCAGATNVSWKRVRKRVPSTKVAPPTVAGTRVKE